MDIELIKGDEWVNGMRRIVIVRTTPKYVWFNTPNNGVEKMRIDFFSSSIHQR